jgi:RNA polymerase sigma-70 factor (ECF subfamily)
MIKKTSMSFGEVFAVTKSRGETSFELEAVFCAQYDRIARVIARVVRNHARAEELAVEVFPKLWKNRRAQGEKAEGWLYRTAVRTALNELRSESRRSRYERMLGVPRGTATPEEIHATAEETERVRAVLGVMEPKQAELILLRSQGLSYEELASALELNPASVGTLLSRAQQAFRKEYVRRYGDESRIERQPLG